MLWIVRGFIGNDWLGWRIAEEVFESFLFESIFGVEFNANFWFFDVVFGILLEVFVDFIFGFCCSHLSYHIRMKCCLVSLDKHLMFLSQGDGLLFPREAIELNIWYFGLPTKVVASTHVGLHSWVWIGDRFFSYLLRCYCFVLDLVQWFRYLWEHWKFAGKDTLPVLDGSNLNTLIHQVILAWLQLLMIFSWFLQLDNSLGVVFGCLFFLHSGELWIVSNYCGSEIKFLFPFLNGFL